MIEDRRSDITGLGISLAADPAGVAEPFQGKPMSSTYFSLHFRLIFSTKDRKPTLDAKWRGRLHEFLAGTVKGHDSVPEAVGGVDDHVHVLVSLRPTHCLSDFMRELKKAGSVWVHDVIGNQSFEWQVGYAAFTVSPTARDDVMRYISNQELHHRKKPF